MIAKSLFLPIALLLIASCSSEASQNEPDDKGDYTLFQQPGAHCLRKDMFKYNLVSRISKGVEKHYGAFQYGDSVAYHEILFWETLLPDGNIKPDSMDVVIRFTADKPDQKEVKMTAIGPIDLGKCEVGALTGYSDSEWNIDAISGRKGAFEIE